MSSKRLEVVSGMARQRRELATRMQEASTEATEFLRRRGGHEVLESGTYRAAPRPPMPTLPSEVTLVVYGWENVQPGTLAWVFPSLKAAIEAARALRNAVRWVIVAGEEALDVATARASGFVLAESV